MALIGINPAAQRQPKTSTLEKVAQAVQIAQGVTGLALAVPEYLQKRELLKQEAAGEESKRRLEAAQAEKIRLESQPLPDTMIQQLKVSGIDPTGLTRSEALKLFETPTQRASRQRVEAQLEFLSRADKRAEAELSLKEQEASRKAREGSPEAAVEKIEVNQLMDNFKSLKEMRSRLADSKRAWQLVQRVSTGPVVGSAPAAFLRRVQGDVDFQDLERLLNKEGLEAVKNFAKEAGARSIDTERERAYLERTIPGVDKPKEVIENSLLAIRSLVTASIIETQQKKEWIDAGRSLKDFKSPIENTRSYYNRDTGEIRFVVDGAKPPEGFESIAARLESGGSVQARETRTINGIRYEKIEGGWRKAE